jgi:hypothetical protein
MSSAIAETGRAEPLPPLADDARLAAWWVAVGLVAGSLAGAVVGGIGGRLAMLVLRLATPDLPVGLISDDGFEIGSFNLRESLGLYAGMAALGAGFGLLYAAVRGLLPRRGRIVLFGLFGAAVGGASFVHTDGVDFTLLEPRWFAVASFVALPGLAAAAIAALVERADAWTPWRCPRRAALLALPGLPGLVVLPVAVVGAGAIVVLARVRVLRAAVPAVGRLVVPAALLAVTAAAGISLVRDAVAILD